MDNRIARLAELIDRYVERQGGRHISFVQEHLDEVADYAGMIAEKRGLDVELARMSGMLHDIHTLTEGYVSGHAKHCVVIARDLLSDAGIVDEDELETICTAIANHSKKRRVDDVYSEVLKDADTLSHNVPGNINYVADKERARYTALCQEFDLREKRI